jgi:DHA2 family lincomycin resistance protein-like MFS transporter
MQRVGIRTDFYAFSCVDRHLYSKGIDLSSQSQSSARTHNPKAVIAVAAFAAFIATFNETFLNIGFQPIMDDFGVRLSTVQWLAGAYMLGAAVMVPVSAFLYRSVPTRRLFLATVALLAVGSVVGALAPSFLVLLVGRIVQALGTGLLIPVGMNITLAVAPRSKLGVAMGIMGAMTALGPSLSIIVAGALLSVFSWHALLWCFALMSALCFASGAVLLGNISELTRPKLDAASVALIGLALIGILYGVSAVFEGNVWVSAAAVVIGVLALIVFLTRQGKLVHPLIDLRALSVPPFAIGVVMVMIALIVMFAMNILIPVFLQSSLGVAPMAASLTLFPAIVLAAVIAPFAGRIYDKHGVKALLPSGFAVTTAAVAVLAVGARTGSLVLIAAIYIFVISGVSFVFGPVQSFALSRLEPELHAHGVTIMSTGFQIAGCVGASVFSGVYAATITGAAAGGASAGGAADRAFLTVGVILAVICLAGLVLAFLIGRHAPAAKAAPAASSVLSEIAKHDVYTLGPNDLVLDALRGFVDKGVSGMPIVNEGGGLLGFVSDGDVMRYLADQHPAFTTAYSLIVEDGNERFDDSLTSLLQLPLAEIATKHVVSVEADMELGEVCRILSHHHLKKAPVLRDGKMVGIVNRSNITRYSLTTYLENLAPAPVAGQPG